MTKLKSPEVLRNELRRKWRTKYGPDDRMALFELLITLIPFFGLWGLFFYFIDNIYAWAILALLGFLKVRLFALFHDLGHGGTFSSTAVNNWLGRFLGVLVWTPYKNWKASHAEHHLVSGLLDRRGVGDILTMTVAEYRDSFWLKKLLYRAVRQPTFFLLIGPVLIFGIVQRFSVYKKTKTNDMLISVHGTSIIIALFAVVMIQFMGFWQYVIAQLVITTISGSIGIWLFYIQHQYPDAYWKRRKDWNVAEASLYGSSYYVLPNWLNWFTCNIGIHHVHHLYGKIPFYHLPTVVSDYPELTGPKIIQITLWESLKSLKCRLWCEKRGKLVSFKEARNLC